MRQRSVAEMCVGGLPGVCRFGLKRVAANHAEVALDFASDFSRIIFAVIVPICRKPVEQEAALPLRITLVFLQKKTTLKVFLSILL